VKVWTGWSRQAFKELWPYLRLALPGAAHICLEWWGFEVLMLLTGRLGATVSAAQTVVFNTISLLFMIPLAISVAVTTRAGQALGAGDEVLAKLTSKLSLIMVAGVQSCIGLTLIALRHKWGYIFSNSEAVVGEVATVLPVCGCYAVLDAICGVSAGILRACGKQMVGAVTNIIAYWAIGIPISYVLGIQQKCALPRCCLTSISVVLSRRCSLARAARYGLIGMHFGLAVALTFNFTVMMTYSPVPLRHESFFASLPLCSCSYIARINWNAQVSAAADRTRRKSDEVGGDLHPFLLYKYAIGCDAKCRCCFGR
jgi:Na+-driven multidrug efflux pump